MILKARGNTGGMMGLKHAPQGTPYFDAEAPGVGQPGNCCALEAQFGPLRLGPLPQLESSGEGASTVALLYSRYPNTSV